eukprot:445623_1
MSTPFYGKSQYGERLDFKSRKYCNDFCCAAIYITHVIGLIYSIFHIYIIDYDELDSSQYSINDPNSVHFSGCFIVIAVSIISGLICGTIWLLCIRKFSKYVIQIIMVSNILIWFACFIIGIATFNLGLLISGIIISVLYTIYYAYFAFLRVPFSRQILSLGNYIINDYFKQRDRAISFIICISMLLDIGWLFIWGASFFGYIIIATEIDKAHPLGWIIFLYILSLYWGLSVNSNINHTILCTVIASWYYSSTKLKQTKHVNEHPISNKAIWNVWTKQFGSITLGASLVPCVAAIRAFFDVFINDDEHSVIGCMCLFCSSCLSYLYSWFNTYSFGFMAIYGNKFIDSSDKIYKLMDRRGLNKILIDDITGIAIFCACLVSGLFTSVIAYGIGFIYYGQDTDININIYVVNDLAVYGGVIGLIMCLGILRNVRSAIIAMWVCFAEHPAFLERNRQMVFKKLIHSHENIAKLNMQIVNEPDEIDKSETDEIDKNDLEPVISKGKHPPGFVSD